MAKFLEAKIGRILDFGFCEALQCVARNLFFEYDYFDSTAGNFGLAVAGRWAADYYDLLWFVMIFPLMDELSKAKKDLL